MDLQESEAILKINKNFILFFETAGKISPNALFILFRGLIRPDLNFKK
jgi:hypothetical protein